MIHVYISRVCLGVAFIVIFLAIIFDIWSLVDIHSGGQYGSIVFNVIGLGALLYIMVVTKFLQEQK